MEHLFCYALLNAFFDASDANFSLTRGEVDPYIFRLYSKNFKAEIKSILLPADFFWKSLGQKADYPRHEGKIPAESKAKIFWHSPASKSPFQPEGNISRLGSREATDFTPRKIPEKERLSVRRVLVETQFYGHPRIGVKVKYHRLSRWLD